MSERPTPDTDAKWQELCCSNLSWYHIAENIKAHCQEKERERDEAREESLEQARLLGISGERECRLIAERDEARREILGWENKWNAAVEMAALAENERDRLRERLTNTEDQLDYALICIRRLEGRLTESEP